MTDPTAASVTTQLRRYEMVPGVYADFAAWWRSSIVPVREQAGFTVEWAYVSEDESEFLWAVSVEGSVEDFVALESAYMSSDARAAAFAGQPKRVERMHLSFVGAVGSRQLF